MPRSMPGRLRPLRERSSPPTATVQWTSAPSTRSTVNCTSPSLRYSRLPGFTTRGSGAKLIETRSRVPTMSSEVSVNVSPGCNRIGSGSIWPRRIFGPGRSAMMATRRPVARSAARMRAMRCRVPVEVAVRKIQPRHVHAGADQTLEHLRRIGGRTDGGHDLGFMIRQQHVWLHYHAFPAPTEQSRRIANHHPTTPSASFHKFFP